MKVQKRGLSDVVATVLIILLTVLAVTIVARFVIPYVSNSLSQGGECFQYKDYYKFQESLDYKGKNLHFNCYNETSKIYGMAIGAFKSGDTSDTNLSKVNETSVNLNIVFVRSDTGESTTVEIRKEKGVSMNDGGVRMLNQNIASLKVPNVGEVQTYVYNSSTLYNAIEVYPVLGNGRVCEKSDRIDLIKCSVSLYV